MKQDIVNEALKERFLLQKEYLGDNKLVNQINPLVSITVATYQHVDYIKQCLDGILMQKTNFLYEVIIGEDGSIDGTQEICKEYARKYPDKIRLFIRDRKLSQFVTDNSEVIRFNGIWNRMSARGKYIAWCEGDDYWTAPYKLQKQVDFLESHPDYVMCSHRFDKYWQENGVLEEDADKDFKGADYDLQNLIGGKWLTQTLTVMYRRSALDLKQYERYGMSMDIILFYELLKHGKGYCFPEAMGVYRYHNGGVWSEVSQNQRRLVEFKARLAIYNVEQSDMAAMFLLYQFAKAMSRRWMLEQWRMMVKVFRILKKHYGSWFLCKFILEKLLLGKGLYWDDIPQIKAIK